MASEPTDLADDGIDHESEAAAVARRYRRIERPASGVFALLVAGLVVFALLSYPLVPALVVGAVVVIAVRAPVVRTDGTARLRSDADAGAVRADFADPRPPVLALQWGIAEEVRATENGAAYEIRYLFGLRSVTMTTTVSERGTGDEPGLEIEVTAGGRRWATYTVSIAGDGTDTGATTVRAEWSSDRRFGLRRLPAWFVAERYREEALAAQGYAVLERDTSIGL